MTVKELRAALDGLPDNMRVLTEGCDCIGNAWTVEVEEFYDFDLECNARMALVTRNDNDGLIGSPVART